MLGKNLYGNTRAKILIIENSIDITGSLKAILRTSTILNDNFDFVFVLPLGSRALKPVRENGFKIHEVRLLELSKRWQSLFYIPQLIRSLLAVKQIARKEEIDLIHVNDFYNMIMPLWRMFGGKVPYICSVNFVPDRFPLTLRKAWIFSHVKWSSRIIAVSHHVFRQLPNHSKVIYIPNSLPPEKIDSTLAERAKICLYVGNYIEGKGQDMAIRAFAKIGSKFPEWKLRFVGGDMGMEKNTVYKLSLMKLAGECGIENRIEWKDFSTEITIEYQSASIALNFSRSESFSLTVQEAMFYGCATIATKSGGPSELIEHGYTGLLVGVNNLLEMSSAVEELIMDSSMRNKLARNGKESIVKKFSKEKTADLLHQVYNNILLKRNEEINVVRNK